MQFIFCLFISFISTTIFAAMPINKEVRCEINEMSFFVNGNQTSKNNPTNQKPTFHRFDGKQLISYYKGASAPTVASNGASFISRETVKSGGDRSFDVTKFEKNGAMINKLDFFKEVSGNTTQLNLIETYSNNNFASFGRNRSICFIN